MTARRPVVFLSHISEEGQVASAIKDELERAFLGIVDTFVSSDPRSLTPGIQWLEAVNTNLRTCAAMLVLASPESVRRAWVNFELGAAWARRVRVVPICHLGMGPSDLPMPLSEFQAVRLTAEEVPLLFTAVASFVECDPPRIDAYEVIQRIRDANFALPMTAIGDHGPAPRPAEGWGGFSASAAAVPTTFVGGRDQAIGLVVARFGSPIDRPMKLEMRLLGTQSAGAATTFTRPPWILVVSGDAHVSSVASPVVARSAAAAVSGDGRSCEWTIWEGTAADAAFEIRGTDGNGLPLPSGPSSGPRVDVHEAEVRGPFLAEVALLDERRRRLNSSVVTVGDVAVGSLPVSSVLHQRFSIGGPNG